MGLPAVCNDNDYKNWVRACLGLKFLKEGLVDYVDNEVKAFQRDILVNVCGSATCNGCTTDDLTRRPRPRPCPNNVCDKIRDKIQTEYRYRHPQWDNTDATKWCTNHWEMAKCFMSPGHKAVTSSADTDVTGILSICINGLFMPMARQIIPAHQQPPVDIYHKNRGARNTILHSGSMSLSDIERQNYIQDMILLLANYKHPVDIVTQDAINKLRQLNGGMFITPTDELTALKSKLDAIDSSQQDLKTKVDAVQQEQQNVDTRQQDIQDKVDNIKQQTDISHGDIATKIDTMEKQYKAFDTNQRDLATKIDTVEHEHKQLGTSHRNLGTKVDTVEQEQTRMRTSHRDLGTKVDTVEQEQTRMRTSHRDLGTKVDTVEQEQTRMRTSHKDLGSKVDTVEQEQTRMLTSQKDLDTKVSNIKQEVDTGHRVVASKVDNLQQRVDLNQSNQKDLETNVETMHQQVDSSQRDINTRIDSIEQRVDTNRKGLDARLTDMQQQYDSSRQDIEAIQQEQGRVDIVSIEQQIQKNGESLSELNDKLLQFQLVTGEDIRDVKQQYSSLIDRNDALHKLITDLPVRVESIEGEMIHQASRIDKMDARMGDIEDRTMSLAAKAIQTHVTTNTKSDVLDAGNSGIEDRQHTMKAIQNYLLAKYKAELKTISMPPLLQRIKVNIDDVYTELVIRDDLVHKKKETAPEDEKSKAGNTSKLGNRVKNYTDILHDGKKTCTNVFVIGKAGVGKTTWSRKLISTWCDSMNQDTGSTSYSTNEAALRKYDLVFYIELRSAKSVSHIMNMIEDQLFLYEPDLMKNVKTLMENEEYSSRCLIVLDGLDEWVSRDQSKTKDGLPARDPRWKSTIITSTRSWKLEELQLETQAIDRAVEIQGLQDDSAKRLMKEVVSALNTATGNHKNVGEFNNQCPGLVRRCMEVPLLLNTFVCLWYEEGRIDELLAGTFCGLVELLIKYAEGDARTQLFQKIPTEKLDEAKQMWKGKNSGVPDFLLKRRLCSMYGPFLLRLGKIAFDHLFTCSRESSLVFDHQSITDVISDEELEIAVTIGLLSQTTHCGSVLEEQFSLSFLHKTLQEFLASVYMVSNGLQSNPCLDTYSEYCTDVYKVLEMENVLLFVCGLCPELAGQMSRHIASMERNEKVHKLLLRCVRQERITSSTSRYIYIKHHFLYGRYDPHNDMFDYNTDTISLLDISNDKDTTLCLNIEENLDDVLQSIADITNVKLVEADLRCSMMSEQQTIEFEESISVMNNKLIKIDRTFSKIILSGTFIEKMTIASYTPISEQCKLDLSECKSLRTVEYMRSTVPIQLPTERLEEVVIRTYKPRNAPVLDLSGCKSLRTVEYNGSTAPIQLPTEQLEEVVIRTYKPRNAPVLDLSGCKSLRTVQYRESTAPIQLPTERLEEVVILYYTPRDVPVLDLSGCKSLRTVQYRESTAPIQLPTERLEEVVILYYTPRDVPVLDLSGCKSLRTVQYWESTAPIQLPTERLEEVVIRTYTPDNAPVLDLSGCKSLRTVRYEDSTGPIQLPTEQLEEVVIRTYKPRDVPVLDLSGCKSLRTVVYTVSTVPIQLPTEQLEKVVISRYKPHNAPVLDLSGCKSLRTVKYLQSTAPIQLPTEQLEKVVISRYKPHNAPVLDLSGCKSLKFLRYSVSTAPVLLPPEQVLKTKITECTPRKYWWEDLTVPEPILYRDTCVLEVDPFSRNLIRRH